MPPAGRPARGTKRPRHSHVLICGGGDAGSRQYSRSIEGPSGMGERTTPRWLRRTEGAPRVVDAVWAGPPEISLDNRAGLLAVLRRSVNEAGFELRTVRRGCRRRVIAEGRLALDLLRRQEGRADAKGHWWLDDVTWATSTDGSKLVYWADPDGYDLLFLGWGPAAKPCLEVIRAVLDAHRHARSTYAVAKGITDRREAQAACHAVLDVLSPVVARAVIDAYSDYRAEMPPDVASVEARLRDMGRQPGHGDPGMGVEVALDEDGWQLVRTYASWSIHVELRDDIGGDLGTFHDCGYSVTAELTDDEAAALRRRLAGIAPLTPLSEARQAASSRWGRLFRRGQGHA